MSRSSAELRVLLSKVAVFENAAAEEITALAEMGIERQVEEGGFFFFQGDPAEYAYVLLSGRAKLCQIAPDGQQVNLRTIAPHNLFGAIGAVQQNTRYPACAQALEDCSTLALPSLKLHQLIQAHPHLSFGMMRLMTGYIQEMQERYRENSTEKVEQRIARVLLRLAGQIGRKADNGVELDFSRQELAEMAGTTLYTISRTLSAWEKQGLMNNQRERVILTRPHEILRIAEGMKR